MGKREIALVESLSEIEIRVHAFSSVGTVLRNADRSENPAGLTGRERDVVVLLSHGMRNDDIAERLVVSHKTVDHHAPAILRKLSVHPGAKPPPKLCDSVSTSPDSPAAGVRPDAAEASCLGSGQRKIGIARAQIWVVSPMRAAFAARSFAAIGEGAANQGGNMRLSTAITAATAAVVTLAIAAPGAGAMVNTAGGAAAYSRTSTTHADGLVSGAAGLPDRDRQAPRTGDLDGAPRGHTVGFRGCPRVGPCMAPYRVVIDGSSSKPADQTTATSQQPFQWADAGIGAGAILLLLGVGGGAAVATRRQRHRLTAS